MKASVKSAKTQEYATFLGELKQRIASARLSAARAVNRDLILLYWDIGRGIVEKQEALGWGESVVELLSRDLQKAFPGLTGFSAANLWRMRQFYAEHSAETFLAQVAREVLSAIPWWHHVVLLSKVKNPAGRFYYFHAAAKLGWSRNVLLNQIKAKAYERSLAEGKAHNFPAVLPDYLAEQAEEALKSSYNSKTNPIGVAEYHLTEKLPKELKGGCPMNGNY
jgi:predicted nuclease of restriction endonuclease-like (RecB) superfamily